MKLMMILTTCVVFACTAAQPVDAPIQTGHGIAVIGASASAGWGIMVPVLNPSDGNRYRHVTLADALLAVDPKLPRVVTQSGDPMFFRKRRAGRAAQVNEALAAQPEAVIAIDFLFWYGYGTARADTPSATARIRMDRLAVGLQQIDRLAAKDIPIIVGDLPDVSAASGAMVYSVIGDAQIPKPDVLIALNNRIATWAAANERIHVLPLSSLMHTMSAGKGVSAGGVMWGPEPRLMQHDRLHPTAEGLLAVAASASDHLHAAQGVAHKRTPVDKVAARFRLRQGAIEHPSEADPKTTTRPTNADAP